MRTIKEFQQGMQNRREIKKLLSDDNRKFF